MNKKTRVYLPVFIVVAIIVVASVVWYLDYIKYVSTDDAFVEYNTVTASPKMMGRIEHIYFEEGDNVHKGDLLFELDSVELIAQRDYLESIVSEASAKASEVQASYNLYVDQLKVLNIALEQAKKDYDRAKTEFDGGVITKQVFEHAENAYQSKNAQVNAGKKQIQLASAAMETAQLSVQKAEENIDVVRTKIANTKVFSVVDGVIVKRWLLPGDIAQTGQSIYSIIDNQSKWVKVFLEETKLEGIHNGSNTEFTIDTYDGETFTGKVYYVGSSTESQFSLIPSNNAAGNYTKVTQRIPIKIELDSDKSLADHPLLAGMSVVVKIFRN